MNKAAFFVGVSDLLKLLRAGESERDPKYRGLEIRGKGRGEGDEGNGCRLPVGVYGADPRGIGDVALRLVESSEICFVPALVRNIPSNSASLDIGVCGTDPGT